MSIEINELIQIPSQLLRQGKTLIVMSQAQHLTLYLNDSQHWSNKKHKVTNLLRYNVGNIITVIYLADANALLFSEF